MSENYILLVDDNEDDIDLTIRAIRKTNIDQSVVVARDGQEALDYLFAEGEYAGQQHELPSVVLLDLKLPKVDGLQVLQRMRADVRTRRVPVVILTSSNEEQDLLRSLRRFFRGCSRVTREFALVCPSQRAKRRRHRGRGRRSAGAVPDREAGAGVPAVRRGRFPA